MNEIVRTIEDDNFRLDVYVDHDAKNPLYSIDTIGLFIFFNEAPEVMRQVIFKDYEEALEAFRKNTKILFTKHIYRSFDNKFTLKDQKEDGSIGVCFITYESFFAFIGYAYEGSGLHNKIINDVVVEELGRLTSFLEGDCYRYILYEDAEKCDENNTFTTCNMVDPVKRKLWNMVESVSEFYGDEMNKNGMFESVKNILSGDDAESFFKLLFC